ncbi:ESPR domain-containing protein [Paraburkholderia dipogonis]|uniref:ESPR domain-containing protein n=1 Tax=Paraburkholderia dipogonis TaxID=1211383 RepID=UPI0038B79E0F
MNKSYKTVWNETTGTYVAAPEVAKSRGKESRSKKALVVALLAAGAGSVASMHAYAGAVDGGTANGGPTSEAIGTGATTAYNYDIAVGYGATTVGGANNNVGAIAIGAGATAYGGGAVPSAQTSQSVIRLSPAIPATLPGKPQHWVALRRRQTGERPLLAPLRLLRAITRRRLARVR